MSVRLDIELSLLCVCMQPMDDALALPLDMLIGSLSESELAAALELVVEEAVAEVMSCTNLQPSVPGVVCEVISDIVRHATADIDADVGDAVNGSADKPQAESTCHTNAEVQLTD